MVVWTVWAVWAVWAVWPVWAVWVGVTVPGINHGRYMRCGGVGGLVGGRGLRLPPGTAPGGPLAAPLAVGTHACVQAHTHACMPPVVGLA